jgi:2-aminoadipate transaminase
MQAALFEFLRRGRLEANLERARTILRERRDALLTALDEHFGPRSASWSRPEGGYFVWLDLPEGVSAADVADRAAAAGVAVVKGADFYPGGTGGTSSLRLAFSFVPPAQLAEGIARLAAAVPAAAPV